MWVNYKPIDVELDGDSTGIYQVCIFLNFSDLFHCSLSSDKNHNDQIHSFLLAVQIHGNSCIIIICVGTSCSERHNLAIKFNLADDNDDDLYVRYYLMIQWS